VSGAPAGDWILVVDDDAAIRETLRVILEDEGYPVITAAQGKEALERLEAGPPPALCIVDLMMPVCNGWELCAELARRPALSGVPVLLVSAHDPLEAPPSGPQTVHVMGKPIRFDRLLRHVERYCRPGPR
jgi:two-component system chemotaxis response regulator CheY